ncbi:MBL fold metallo-hydrolase [Acetobacteraceae bacterium ESL0709]|nr:MBL fold metallo-hydrolase [Acetobacteraceae bacterium ESL0697]MDF7678266.1 MBL fold metallo-hydrolase [Acetobacteraceae bacterium ESL0709]
MKITILGCGSSPGVPMIGGENFQPSGLWGDCDPLEPRNRRTRSSAVIEKDGYRLLIDCGPDFRSQMLANNLGSIDAVIITHAHSDHIAGLDELRAVNRVIERPIPLFATEETMAELKSRFAYAFQPWKGGGFFRPVFEETLIEYDSVFKIGPLKLYGFRQFHGRFLSLGLRCGDFAYSTDVHELPVSSLERLGGLASWVVGCLQYDSHPSHASLEQVMKWRELLSPSEIILTHMGEGLDYQTLRNILPPDIRPAWDGQILRVGAD